MRLQSDVPRVVRRSRVVPENPNGRVLNLVDRQYALEGQDFAGTIGQMVLV